jgi:predicted nucleic acid-binding protein
VRVEAAAALWRKHRLGEIDADDAGLLARAVALDVAGDPDTIVIAVSAGVIADAGDLVERHPLRAYGAVQLASAMAARAASPSIDRFASADRTLARAADREGFALVEGL